MNHPRHLLIPALVLLAAPALAEPPAPPAPPPAAPVQGAAGGWEEHGRRTLRERMDQLHQDLKLTPEQEAAWKTWSDQVHAARQDRRGARPDFEELRQLPAPERLEKMIEFGKARQAAMVEVLDATKTFYGKLTPEQRKTFDDRMPFGEQGPHGRGGRHGPRGELNRPGPGRP